MTYKRWVIVAILLFCIGVGIGAITPADARTALDLSSGLKELAGILVPFTPATALIIYIKNVMGMVISFVLSPVLCIAPIVTLMLNGWLLGYISGVVIEQKSLLFVVAGILPHGIFELPAFIIAEAAALGAGMSVMLALFKKKRRSELPSLLPRYVKFLALALVLLLPATIVETFITPLLTAK